MEIPSADRLRVTTLGECRQTSPLVGRRERFAGDSRVLACADTAELEPFLERGELPSFESAGPRREIFFEPRQLTCGVVTCGGLCPGLNDVIRSVVLTLHHAYGVRRVLGFRYGYGGITAGRRDDPLLLEAGLVETIHEQGGTLLGTSRGPQDVVEMVDQLMKWRVSILFTVGGDGTLSGASAIAGEIARRGLDIAVIGIPKTIDNDLVWTERTFGFSTAVEAARSAITAAHTEARAAWNGIGLVKLMGRHAGFIAAQATLSSGDVNFCLVPEVPFSLDGPGGLLDHLGQRLEERRHAVVVVAEGAGQDLIASETEERDASGNLKLEDVGLLLRQRFREHFAGRGVPMTVKYIDPSYMIRSLPANSLDSSFCLMLGQHAVHAGMAGRTDMMVGFWNHRFTHVPLSLVAGRQKQIEPEQETWQRVLGATGQPPSMTSST
ncbi:MAG: ATP-dependent 6-phosphofructokinase [bacterium]|nr:ATP-dependent 6-phosphofructokinase [bacterium]